MIAGIVCISMPSRLAIIDKNYTGNRSVFADNRMGPVFYREIGLVSGCRTCYAADKNRAEHNDIGKLTLLKILRYE